MRTGIRLLAASILMPVLFSHEPARPQERPADERAWTLALDGALNSKYIWRGLALADGPVLQPSVSLSHGSLTFYLWGSLELTDSQLYPGQGKTAGEFTEADYVLDYTRTVKALELSVGLAHYRFPNTGAPPTTEFYVAASLPLPLAPAVTVVRDVDQAPGYYVSLAAGGVLKSLGDRADLELLASIAWASAGYHRAYYGLRKASLSDGALRLSLPIRLGQYWTLTPTIGCSLLLGSGIKEQVDSDRFLWFGASLSL